MTTARKRLSLAALFLVALPTAIVQAQSDGNSRMSVTVAFGGGLNTATPPGNPANHHELPKTIEIKAGGVVNFAVAGFHQIVVYQPGIEAGDIVPPTFSPGPPPVNLFMNYNLGTAYYVGINPRNANAGTPAAAATVFNGDNRVESVSFANPGVYLVVCNVTPHFTDGMYAYVKVSR
jgi:plastocyanin